MKICVIGSNGHMGSIVRRIGTEKGYEMVGVDQSNSELNFDSSFDGDAIIDFSTAKIMNKTIDFALRNKVPYVVAVTGYEEDIKQRLEAASKVIPVFVSANFSLGVHRLKKLIKYAQELSDKVDIEIIDVHHNRKIDAPSGTATT
jgi:4-hydroxy-tetrahydrodipicolinate reductase